MFYHQVLLHRKGQFGIIWMEAMQSRPFKVSRQDLLQVNIRKSCSDILDYVYARIRDTRGKRKRFSLYLSAHLMYGTVSIWRKQIQFLLTDAQEITSRVRLEFTAIENIDLKAPNLDHVSLPNAVPSQNPDFGSLKHFYDELDDWLLVNVQPDVPPALSTPSPHRHRESLFRGHERFEPGFGTPHTVSSRGKITLQELPFSTSPITEIPIPGPGERDIPEFDGRELELMSMKPEEDVVLTLQDLMPDTQVTPSPPGEKTPEKTPENATEKTPEKAPEKTPEKATEKAGGRAKGEKKRRRRHAGQDDDLDITQTEQPPPAKRPSLQQDNSLELLPVEMEVSPRHRRRRQLFVDVNKQIPKSELKKNMISSDTTLIREFVVPARLPSTPAELFKRPGSKDLSQNRVLRKLWDRNCKESLLRTESDDDTPIWSVPDLVRGERGLLRVRRLDRVDEESSQDEQRQEADNGQYLDDVPLDTRQVADDVPSIEVVREGSLSQSGTPQHSSLQLPVGQSPLEDTSLSRTRSGRKRSRREAGVDAGESSDSVERVASLEEHASVSVDTSVRLDVLPEEVDEVPSPPRPPTAVSESQLFSPERRFIRRCESEGGDDKCTTFKHVCPVTMVRPQAAKCFYTLLGQCAEGNLFVRQHRPYGDIYISTSKHSLPHPPL